MSYIISKIDDIKPDVIIHLGSNNPSYNKIFNKNHYLSNLKFTKKFN